jgi:hypothetical protein
MFVRNEVPSENLLAGTSFLTVFPGEPRGTYFIEIYLVRKRHPVEIRAIK